MWIEVFKTGIHTASNGKTFNVGTGDIDRIISQYDPSYHEAPVVIGHPKEDDPAFGWVQALKREGNVLFAKLKDMVPEFVDMLKKGLFKKRSISLYPDFSLRHVGFLGAMPPAVKGLANIKFKEGDNAMEFSTDANKRKSAGEMLNDRVKEILNNPPKVGPRGERLPEHLSFSEALTIACQENPELTIRYQEELTEDYWSRR